MQSQSRSATPEITVLAPLEILSSLSCSCSCSESRCLEQDKEQAFLFAKLSRYPISIICEDPPIIFSLVICSSQAVGESRRCTNRCCFSPPFPSPPCYPPARRIHREPHPGLRQKSAVTWACGWNPAPPLSLARNAQPSSQKD